jgi:hypothetical protein
MAPSPAIIVPRSMQGTHDTHRETSACNPYLHGYPSPGASTQAIRKSRASNYNIKKEPARAFHGYYRNHFWLVMQKKLRRCELSIRQLAMNVSTLFALLAAVKTFFFCPLSPKHELSFGGRAATSRCSAPTFVRDSTLHGIHNPISKLWP